MRIGLLLAFLVLVVLGINPAAARDLSLSLTGHSTILYDSVRDACDPIDVPDINPRAYRDASGQVVMFALHFINRPLRGPDLTHLKIDCHVSLGSSFDADPKHYDDRRYIAATWTKDGKAVSALVHHEYHADEHKNCRVGDSLGCWFNTVLAFHSTDGGANFVKSTPFVVASAPFTQAIEQGRHRGFFNPSNIFSDGTYSYVFTSTTGWVGQEAGSCLFRSSNPADSGSWRAFDGSKFSVRFEDPYRSQVIPPPCMKVEPFLLPIGSVVRHMKSRLWIAIFQASAGGDYPLDGFYYATGRDLMHWSAPTLLLAGKTAYGDLCKVGPSIINYPALLDPASPSRNFDTIGDHPLLFYAIIKVENCQTGQRLLVHQPVKLDLSGLADKRP